MAVEFGVVIGVFVDEEELLVKMQCFLYDGSCRTFGKLYTRFTYF